MLRWKIGLGFVMIAFAALSWWLPFSRLRETAWSELGYLALASLPRPAVRAPGCAVALEPEA